MGFLVSCFLGCYYPSSGRLYVTITHVEGDGDAKRELQDSYTTCRTLVLPLGFHPALSKFWVTYGVLLLCYDASSWWGGNHILLCLIYQYGVVLYHSHVMRSR